MATVVNRIVLDEIIVLLDAGLLKRVVSGCELLIPKGMVIDLERLGTEFSADRVLPLVRQAITTGTVKAEEVVYEPQNGADGKPLSPVNAMTVCLLEWLKTEPGRVIMATMDDDLTAACKERGIEVVDYIGLKQYLGDSPTLAEPAKQDSLAMGYLRLGSMLLLTFVLGLGGLFLIINIGSLFAFLGWMTSFVVLPVSMIFFGIRTHLRAIYGGIEIVFGTGGAAYVAYTSHATADADAWIKIAGAMYVIVRGLDNIETGLKKSKSPYLGTWNWIWRKKEDSGKVCI